MNKYHNGMAKSGKGPAPGNTGANHAKATKESTAAWKMDIGPCCPPKNKVGFKPIKNAVKSDY